jgi:formate dehydrogenase subunit delta
VDTRDEPGHDKARKGTIDVTDDNTTKLIRMANQIGSYFAAYPDDEATAGVVDHINRFWTRTMRTQLISAAGQTEGVIPVVTRALPHIRT